MHNGIMDRKDFLFNFVGKSKLLLSWVMNTIVPGSEIKVVQNF